MTNTRDRIPAHLRPFVVDQDYGAYDEIDQAVWRFILLQTHARLRQTGISVERIPRRDWKRGFDYSAPLVLPTSGINRGFQIC